MKYEALKEIPAPIQLRMKVREDDKTLVPSHKVTCKQCNSECWESDTMSEFGKFGTTICDDCLHELAQKEAQ